MEPFLLRALLAGLGIALVAGPLGAFVVWRRLAIFGEALAHSALLGVVLALLLALDPTLGLLLFAALLACALWALEDQRLLPTDTILSTLAHGALALGLVVLSFVDWLRLDLMAYLFGDILAVSERDLLLVVALLAVVSAVLARHWRALVSLTIEPDLARVEGVPVRRLRLVLDLFIAGTIALGMKLVGIVLVVSLLVVPVAAARPWARTPEQMALFGSLVGALATLIGLTLSAAVDIPSGPAIVVTAVFSFLASSGMHRVLERRGSGRARPSLARRGGAR
ncbi:MAG: metal ABC transporter permease [Geminicoccaceae bacterium]|nr:metal ABC transporter permease [Geminicoccaceae bacterium]